MANQKTPYAVVRSLSRRVLAAAKRWGVIRYVLTAGVYVVGVLVVAGPLNGSTAIAIVLALTVLQELARIRRDWLARVGNNMLRKLFLAESLGWSISRSEKNNFLAVVPRRLRHDRTATMEPYFEEQGLRPGAGRALQNLEESAWWTSHLATTTSQWFLGTAAALVVLSAIALLLAVNGMQDRDELLTAAQLITSTAMLAFTLDLIHNWLAFGELAEAARKTHLLASYTSPDEEATKHEFVLRLIEDYHVAVARAPLIPERVYLSRCSHLNKIRSEERQRMDATEEATPPN